MKDKNELLVDSKNVVGIKINYMKIGSIKKQVKVKTNTMLTKSYLKKVSHEAEALYYKELVTP